MYVEKHDFNIWDYGERQYSWLIFVLHFFLLYFFYFRRCFPLLFSLLVACRMKLAGILSLTKWQFKCKPVFSEICHWLIAKSKRYRRKQICASNVDLIYVLNEMNISTLLTIFSFISIKRYSTVRNEPSYILKDTQRDTT